MLVSGYQIPVTRDSVQQAVWVAERLIYLPEKTQQGSLVQPTLALSTGDVGTGWLGRTSKPTCMSWGCLSILQTQAGMKPELQSWEQYGTVHPHSPRWASVGYCKISTKPATGSGKDKKISLLFSFFFSLATYNSDSSVKLWHFLSFTCKLLNLKNNNKQKTQEKQNKLKNASFTSFILLIHLRPVWYRIVSTFPAPISGVTGSPFENNR